MSLIESWVGTPAAAAIGWTLVHSLWQGAILAAALLAVRIATRSPRIRYAAACSAMVTLLGAFAVTLACLLPESGYTSQPFARKVFAWRVPSAVDAPNQFSAALAVPWLAPLWLAGVWIFYLGHLTSWISVRQMRRRGVCCPPENWGQQKERLCALLGLSRQVRLLESCIADVPVVIGHLRPLILMPAGLLTGLPPGQVEAILLHELAHVRRCDYLVNVLQRAIEGLLFYHPAVWWISHVIRTERENCCDDLVVAISGNAHEYAQALAALEQNRWSGSEPVIAATGGSLVTRIQRLLYPNGHNRSWTPLWATLVLLATATVAITTLHATPPQEDAHAAKLKAELEAPYRLWLEQDVAYIITDAERAAYLKLTTDPEREHFIQQFWERRNPTPGAPENAFKEEHYRRIAFANKHFRTNSGKPGWQTDRGYIYIVYGPPDEIESHPSGGGNGQPAQPFEDWRYRRVEGVGDDVSVLFIDRTRTGDYRIAPGNGRQ